MNVLSRKTTASIVSLTVALLVCSTFQTVGYAADTKLNISECEIKDKTLSYSGSVSDGEIIPLTVMARKKDDPSDIRYMRIVTPDDDGGFTGSIKIYDKESTADLFDMEVLFQADEDVPAVTFVLTYFNDKKKNENVSEMSGTEGQGMLEFMATDTAGVKIYNNMGVRLDLYNAQETAVKNKIDTAANGFKASATAENVVEIANGSIYAVLAGKADAGELINLIDGFDTESKTLVIKKNAVSNTDRYSALSKEDKTWIASNVYANRPKEGFEDYEEMYKAVRKSIFMRFANTVHYMELSQLILANTDILENDMTTLKNTTNTNVLDTAMANIRKQSQQTAFTSTDAFIKAVNTALAGASSVSGGGGGAATGGSSGGSSSGGGGVNISLKPIVNAGSENSGNGAGNKFNDLAGYDWAADAIEKLTTKGIVSGTASGSFEPSRSITREEFTKLICSAFGFGKGDESVSFKDVSSSDWFAPYVNRATELGIVQGISDSEFGTGRNITREDMSVIIYRAMEKAGIKISGEGETFADDSNIAEYAKASVKALSANGIINGVGDNTFAPKKNAGRAEAAVIIHRCMEKFGI